MWQGALGVVPADGMVSPAYVIAEPREAVLGTYFAYLFTTAAYKNEVNRRSRGIVSDRNRLYWDDFKAMASPVPPYEEQLAIVSYITQATAGIDRAIAAANRKIELLREYRTRLIADVVTGKLDMRAAAADLIGDTEDIAPVGELDDIPDGSTDQLEGDTEDSAA